MKRLFVLTAAGLISCLMLSAQPKAHKVVFDFTKADTASFTTMVLQLKNIMNASPNSSLEVVCYGTGIDFLMKARTTKMAEIEEFQTKHNIVFAACEASLRRRGIDKSELLPQAKTVPLASLEISSREQEGWSYIKAGY